MKQYLTPKSKPYFDKITSIVINISKILESEIFIYGGFVRDLIQHYFEYNVNNEIEFIKPNDVDIWVSQKYSHKYSLRSWDYTIRNLYNRKDELNITFMGGGSGSAFSDREVYSLVKIVIDNITFDMTTDINFWSVYNDLSDFTVNNLSIDMNHNITQRTETKYTIDEIITHIKDKSIVCCINHKKLDNYIKFYCDETNYYKSKLRDRLVKMEGKNYKRFDLSSIFKD